MRASEAPRRALLPEDLWELAAGRALRLAILLPRRPGLGGLEVAAAALSFNGGLLLVERFAQEQRTAALARSSPDAARSHPSARSLAASMRMLATSPERSRAPPHSSNRAAIASAWRCCSLISSVFSDLGDFGCVAHLGRETSLHSRLSRRTFAGSQS
jgi:hypothetical protein